MAHLNLLGVKVYEKIHFKLRLFVVTNLKSDHQNSTFSTYRYDFGFSGTHTPRAFQKYMLLPHSDL